MFSKLIDREATVSRGIVALVACQIGLHACMAGMRIAIPLKALSAELSVFVIGLLVACFSIVPAVLALHFGRFTDRCGFHRPMRIAAGLSVLGAFASMSFTSVLALIVGASCCGAGAGFGMIAVQRTGSRLCDDAATRLKVFSWIALAPAIGGLIGPVVTGISIDGYGFAVAFGLLTIFPMLTLLSTTQVPHEVGGNTVPKGCRKRSGQSSLAMLKETGLRHILLINLFVIASWDVHNFALPILGHSRSFSAAEIGAVFAAYAAATIAVRMILPFVVDYLPQRSLLVSSLLVVASVFTFYPLMSDVWMLMVGAGVIGCALGMVQPTIMTILHDVSPQGRHGEALALRSMLTQGALTCLPLCYGLLGAYAGSAIMFWLMATALIGGAWLATRFSANSSLAAELTKPPSLEKSNV
ncbi:MFS transporter [Pseudomaricurvus alkylphenolicus]|uniref:MFS transporter n=1 Tax=Pseudomaricurvus alkylphenolicus TaxID=1306991 RepID=UPI00141F561B|nr:MFS transporter [Pseudomaricurvus alkylphenolicus]NIB44089.1 MFS transporter [Pseudomaricurvus alkylphenolicus]